MTQQPIQIGNYSVLYILASGAFSDVYVAIHVVINIQVAIKRIKKSEIKTCKDAEHIHREIAILREVHHQHIVGVYEIIEDDTSLNFVMELANNGSLADLIAPGQPMSEDNCRRYFTQIIKALGYLHTHLNILHRDIKAENVLLDDNHNIRISDFGLSNHYDPNVQQTFCGSYSYAAPELIGRQPYSGAADVWSCGVLLYYLATGNFPFMDLCLPVLLNKIMTKTVIIPQFVSPKLRDLLSKLLAKDPNQRIAITDILQHPWITELDYEEKLSPQNKIKKFDPKVDANIIDEEIIHRLEEMGANTQQIVESLNNKEINSFSAMYRILEQLKVNEELANKELMFRPHACISGSISAEISAPDFSGHISQTNKVTNASPRSQMKNTGLLMTNIIMPHNVCRKTARGPNIINYSISAAASCNVSCLPPLKATLMRSNECDA